MKFKSLEELYKYKILNGSFTQEMLQGIAEAHNVGTRTIYTWLSNAKVF
jgi:hypothetical protein